MPISVFNDKVRVGIKCLHNQMKEMLQGINNAPTPGLAITLAPTIPVLYRLVNLLAH
jgi:hypothetical protein